MKSKSSQSSHLDFMKNHLLGSVHMPANVSLFSRLFVHVSGRIERIDFNGEMAGRFFSTDMLAGSKVSSRYQQSHFSKAMEYVPIAFFVDQSLRRRGAQITLP